MKRTEVSIILQNSSESETPVSPRSSTNMNHSHIPVPKISVSSKSVDRLPPVGRESSEKNAARTLSVAAQRAAFEKLESQDIQPRIRSFNNSPFSDNQRNNPAKKLYSSLNFSRTDSFGENKWKTKFEDSEKLRKMAILRSETGKFKKF